MRKTAMQQAIEYLRKYSLLSAAVILEDRFLEEEKRQIMNAVSHGTEVEAGIIERNYSMSAGEQYYNETFK
jgi:hypothetical protein